MPNIIFKHDRTLEMGDHMEKLFETLKSDDDSDTRE
jgi:ribosome-binding factor A